VFQDGVDVGSHVFAVHQDGLVGAVTQSGVKHGPVLREVDLLSGEHGIAGLLELARAGQGQEKLEHLRGDAVLRIIEKNVAIVRSVEFQAEASIIYRILQYYEIVKIA
jgi:hypothetical protein